MKNTSDLHYVLFLSIIFLVDVVTSLKLDEFLKSIEKVNLNSGLNLLRTKRSNSIEELLSKFSIDDDNSDSDLEPGDAWYQSFRKMECLHGADCSKRSLHWKIKKYQPDDDYDYYDDEEEPNLQDQWEQTKNDLSHEANYKLSKMEQEAVEQKLPKHAWPVQHSNSKRHVNPMLAVKLKTSLKMSKNGYGPTLPSSFLEKDKQKITINDILSDTQQDDYENPDPWKESYETVENRKLLSVESDLDGSPVAEGNICHTKDCLSHGMDLNQFDNIKQKNELGEKVPGILFDNVVDNTENKVAKKGILSSFSDQLMNSDAFVKFQKFISRNSNAGSKKNTTTTTTTTTTTVRPIKSNLLNLVDKDRDVNIKFHMSVNATVLGNGRVPEGFHNNNTITFNPAVSTTAVKNNKKCQRKKFRKKNSLDLDLDLDAERRRRGVVFPILTSTSKRKANEEINKVVNKASDNYPLDEIITGKLTSQLVHTIFSLVKTSPNLKVLWPGLMKNKVAPPKEVQNFYAIRNHDNESEMKRTELMLREAMETINGIIEQQVRDRSCVPLRPDLKSFYELIIQTQLEKIQNEDNRQKRGVSLEDALNSPIDDSEVRKKSRIVKKLLKDYEELPREEQEQISNIKESLLLAAEQLKEFEEISRRRKRQIIADQNLKKLMNSNVTSSSSSLLSPVEDDHFSQQFIKLARTAEMISHNSIKDSDLRIDFNSI